MRCPKCGEKLLKQIAHTAGDNGAEAGDVVFKGMVLVKGGSGELQVKCGVCKTMLRLGNLIVFTSREGK